MSGIFTASGCAFFRSSKSLILTEFWITAIAMSVSSLFFKVIIRPPSIILLAASGLFSISAGSTIGSNPISLMELIRINALRCSIPIPSSKNTLMVLLSVTFEAGSASIFSSTVSNLLPFDSDVTSAPVILSR